MEAQERPLLLEQHMSDPVNPFTQQAPDTEAPAASATPGAEIP